MDRKILKRLLKIYLFPINCILKKTNKHNQKALKSELFKNLYNYDEYCLMSFYPKAAADYKIKSTNINFEDTAIVIQGPLTLKDDFTVNTIKLYKQYYTNINIIVSTWIDSDKDAIEILKKLNVSVVLNEYPEFSGYGNINYQLITSYSGVKKAKELGVKYILKTRTDQRFYNPCALSILRGIYRDDKIVMMGAIANSYYSRCFFVSDFMAFGSSENMISLYDCNLIIRERKKTLESNKKTKRFQDFIKLVNQAEINCDIDIPFEYDDSHIQYECAEIYIAYQYFCKKNNPDNFSSTKEAYDDFLKKQVIIVDADSLGFYWFKYDHQVLRQTWFDRPGKLDMGKWYSILYK